MTFSFIRGKGLRTSIRSYIDSSFIREIGTTHWAIRTPYIILNFQMGNYLGSFPDKTNVVSEDVVCILKSGRFCLHKWIATDREILTSLPVIKVSSKIVTQNSMKFQYKQHLVFVGYPKRQSFNQLLLRRESKST